MITSLTRSLVSNKSWYRSMLAGNDAYAPSAYELIETVAPSGVSTLTFASIPSTYKHLQIRWTSRASTTNVLRIRINGVTTTSYATHWMWGDGSSVQSNYETGATYIELYQANYSTSGTTDAFATGVTDILDYASTSKNTTIRSLQGKHGDSGANRITLQSGLFDNTAAVSSITLLTNALNFASGSRFSLYGIKGD